MKRRALQKATLQKMIDITEVAAAARELATHIANDVNNTQSRGEYIRITQFAMEADRVATALEKMVHDDN